MSTHTLECTQTTPILVEKMSNVQPLFQALKT